MHTNLIPGKQKLGKPRYNLKGRSHRAVSSASPAVIVRKVVDHHLFLNIIPSNFTARTERKVWCDRTITMCVEIISPLFLLQWILIPLNLPRVAPCGYYKQCYGPKRSSSSFSHIIGYLGSLCICDGWSSKGALEYSKNFISKDSDWTAHQNWSTWHRSGPEKYSWTWHFWYPFFPLSTHHRLLRSTIALPPPPLFDRLRVSWLVWSFEKAVR